VVSVVADYRGYEDTQPQHYTDAAKQANSPVEQSQRHTDTHTYTQKHVAGSTGEVMKIGSHFTGSDQKCQVISAMTQTVIIVINNQL